MGSVGVIGVQIPNNQAVSGEIDLGSNDLVAFEMPESWAGTAITFQSKANRGEVSGGGQAPEDWDDVYDDAGTEVSVTVAASRVVVVGTVTKAAIGALRYLRIRSGTSAAPVNQSPAKEIRVLTKSR